jgi:ABC-type amino acid transport substrate-binding protein
VSNLLRKIFAAGSGVTALVFLCLAFLEARADSVSDRSSAGQPLAPGVSAPSHASSPEQTLTHHEDITIFGTVWGLTLAQDGSGFYNELAADLLDGLDEADSGAVSYQLMPYRRAKSRFTQGNGACIYPSAVGVLVSGGQIGDEASLIESKPLFRARTHLFARRGERAPTGLDDLNGKTVAVPSGSVMQVLLKDTGAEIISVFDETDKARMLLTSRVDYITAMLPDAVLVFDRLGEPLPAFDNDLTFLESNIGFVCHRTAATETFMARLNKRIETLANDRAYQHRLEDAGIWHVPETGGNDPVSLNAIEPAAGERSTGERVAEAHPRPTGLGRGRTVP